MMRSFWKSPRAPTGPMTTPVRHRRFWAWPLLAATMLGGGGWWVIRAVESAMRERLEVELTTIRDAEVTALRIWLEATQADAASLAHDPHVLDATKDLLALAAANARAPRPALAGSRALADLRDDLRPHLTALDYEDFILADPEGRVLGELEDDWLGGLRKGYQTDFLKGAMKAAGVSLPFTSQSFLRDDKGERRLGLPTMLAAAPVVDSAGKAIAVLALRLKPEEKFAKIMDVAHYGDSGETYAFDRRGLMLSPSRFDGDLRRIGLIPDQATSRSMLVLELRDPGVNLDAGARPRDERAGRPLTKPIAEATAGRPGVDVMGYPDYRGVPAVGAWTWLEEYDFGVVAGVNAAEAFRPLTILRRTTYGLLALLGLGAAAIQGFLVVVDRQRRALRRAAREMQQLGQYTLEGKIGQGGMGTVYRASHTLLRRPTAIKLIDSDRASDIFLARFDREAQLTSRLVHPNTIVVFDYGRTDEGVIYYAMEYLDGLNLDALATRFGPLPGARVAKILRQACGSLAEAHDLGLIHRDVKPSNLILGRRGGVPDFVKVLDFGLVKAVGPERDLTLTAPESWVGTPLYLAPEAIRRPDEVDGRADLYALGAVGYFLLTGTPVFRGLTSGEVCSQHLHEAPEPPSARLGRPVEPCLERLILRCLAKDRDDRPRDARALIAELDACLPELEPWTTVQADAWWDEVERTAPGPTLDHALAPTERLPSSPAPHPQAETSAFQPRLL